MKKDLPAKGSEWVRLILSILVLLAFVPLSLYAIPKVMALGDAQKPAATAMRLPRPAPRFSSRCSRRESAAGLYF